MTLDALVGAGDADPTLVAHRGCAGHAPENTVRAVEAAAPHVDAVEIDVRPCGSGDLVVFHDATLDRLTDAAGRVDETPLSELRALDVLASGEPIPTLSELLSAVAALPADLPVNVELKTEGVAEAVVDACDAADVDVLYSSFHPAALRELRAADPEAPLAPLCGRDTEAALELASALDAAAIHPSTDAVAETNVVGVANAKGLAVNAWTAETAADARRLAAADVDGIIANRWDLLDSTAGSAE